MYFVGDSFEEKLDHLATRYSRSKSEDDLTDLIVEILPVCKRDANSWSRRTGIPEQELLSAYLQAVQEAAEEYQPIGLFIKRYHTFKNKKGTDVLRYHRSQKRDIYNTLSLNSKIDNDSFEGDQIEFIDTIADDNSDFSKMIELTELIEQFKEKNKVYSKVIEMLAEGSTKKEIAEVLGQSEYTELARKKVSLARKSFKKFIQ